MMDIDGDDDRLFEIELRRRLIRLAARGPAAPPAEALLRRIRRRRFRRAGWGAAALGLILLAFFCRFPGKPERIHEATVAGSPPRAIEPLSPGAPLPDIEKRLESYFKDLGWTRGRLVKDSGKGVSFVFSGSGN